MGEALPLCARPALFCPVVVAIVGRTHADMYGIVSVDELVLAGLHHSWRSERQ